MYMVMAPSMGRHQLLRALQKKDILPLVFLYAKDSLLSHYWKGCLYIYVSQRTKKVAIVTKDFDWSHKWDIPEYPWYTSWEGPLEILVEFLKQNKNTFGHIALMEFARGRNDNRRHLNLTTALKGLSSRVLYKQIIGEYPKSIAHATSYPKREERYDPTYDPKQLKMF